MKQIIAIAFLCIPVLHGMECNRFKLRDVHVPKELVNFFVNQCKEINQTFKQSRQTLRDMQKKNDEIVVGLERMQKKLQEFEGER